VRARGGFVANDLLLYATGGSQRSTTPYTRTQGFRLSRLAWRECRANSPIRTGWAAGGGGEYGFANNFTLRIEYVDVGDEVHVLRSAAEVSTHCRACSGDRALPAKAQREKPPVLAPLQKAAPAPVQPPTDPLFRRARRHFGTARAQDADEARRQ
jgi:hypothetical protein